MVARGTMLLVLLLRASALTPPTLRRPSFFAPTKPPPTQPPETTDAGEPLTLGLSLTPGARALALALHLNSSLEYLNLESNVVAEKGGKVRVRVRIIVRVRVGL